MNSKSDNLPQTEQQLSRRNFLKIGLGALGALATLEVVGASLLFLRARSMEGEFGGMITAGPVEGFPPGSVTEFADANFFLVRTQDSGFLAIYRRCPHLGCTVTWDPADERFLCPCHASKFDVNGDFEDRPVQRALDNFPVTFEDGMVVVDTASLQNRENFSPDQLAYQ